MITFTTEAIAALNGFGRVQQSDVLRIAAEKAGCGDLEYFMYVHERLPGDRLFPFADCTVAVDPKTAQVMGTVEIDLDPEGGLDIVSALRRKGSCSKTSKSDDGEARSGGG